MKSFWTILGLLSTGLLAAAQDNKAKGPLPDTWPLNANLLPKFAKALPEGKSELTLKNSSHFTCVVQVRSGEKATEFWIDGKQSKKLKLPDGEYSMFFRFKTDLRMREGNSFKASSAGIIFDDDKARKPQDSAEVEGKAKRKP